MKRTNLLSMALLTVLSCISFTACSDDETENGGGSEIQPTERRMIKEIETPRERHQAKYDEQNRLISLDVADNYLRIDYEAGTITAYEGQSSGGERVYEFSLNKDGYIETLHLDEYDYTQRFTYNSDGYLIETNDNYYKEIYEWKDGNLVRNIDWDLEEDRENASCEFEYNDMPNISGIYPHDAWVYIGYGLLLENAYNDLLWASNLFGKQSKNLVSASFDEDEKHTYTYRTNGEGYVTSCTRDGEDVTSYYYN